MPKYMFKKGSPHILNYNPGLLSNPDILVLPDDFDAVYHSEKCKEYGHQNVYVSDRFETAIKEDAVSAKTGKPYKDKQQEPGEIKIEKPTERFTVKATMPDHFENEKLNSTITAPIKIAEIKSMRFDELRTLAKRMNIKVNSYDSKISIMRKVEKELEASDISATP